MRRKNDWMRLTKEGLRCLGVFFALLWIGGCAVSRTPAKEEKTLVKEDAPVFDKRFEDLSYDELDLSRIWTVRDYTEDRENVPIHNNTVADLVDTVKAGVVNLYTLRLEERKVQFGVSPHDLLPIRIPFLSNILDVIPFKVPIPYQREGFSLGSGFIINRQGYILTNAHVVHNATDIRVVMSDGQKQFPAKIIGMDRLTDTALLKMEADTLLTVCPLGNSDHLRTGEMVVAIGNPLGLRHTVTSGLVSAKERISPGLNQKYMDFIQTDSAINPGSSGGPLVNLHGEVVGVNTALVAKAQSIGFAVPINTVKEVMPLLVLGKTERGWFGVRAVPLNAKEAATLNYEGEEGVLVVGVEEGSPAEKAGIKKQDIILRLNGLPVRDFIAFRRKLLGLMPGRRVDLEVFRKGEVFEVSGTLVRKE